MEKTPPKASDTMPSAQARAAMPWLDPSPSPVQEPEQPQLNDPADPDARDLPPGVILPEAAAYKLNQIKTQVVNFGAMTLLAVLWAVFVIPDKPQIGFICAGITGAGMLFALIRFVLARRSYQSNDKA